MISTASHAQENSDTKREVEEAMQQLRIAILNRDSTTLGHLLSDDVTYGHSNGLSQTKAEVIRSIMSGQHDYRRIETRSSRVRIYDRTALVNAEVNVSMLLEGKALELDMDILLVWMNDAGRWSLLARKSVRNN
ncbi:MAG: nuclear transport factor 2 family protein [Bacteroidota bacterium]